MPRVYRRRGYSRTFRRSRWPFRSWRRRSVVRAEQSGRRTFTCSIPSNEAFQLIVPAKKQWSNLVAVSPYFYSSEMAACKCSLIASQLYRVYTTLYDQVKINGVTCKISVMTSIGAGGLVPAAKFVTQWDRDAQYKEVAEGHDLPTTNSLEIGSESQSKLIVNNSRAILYRSNWASDLQEKSTFHDCSIDLSGSTWYDRQYHDGPVGYSPSLFMALMSSAIPPQGSSYTFDVAVEATWRVTFRNPKFGLTVGDSSGRSGLSRLLDLGDLNGGGVVDVKDDSDDVLPDVEDGGKKSSKKFDDLSDEEKAKIMELIGSMEDEGGA